MRDSHSIIAARVGERLKTLRGELTQAEFARQLGISQAQYNRYETGKRLAPDSILLKVAGLKGISPREVIWGEGPAGGEGAAPDYVQAVARLVGLLDPDSLEDLYYFLRQKTQHLSRRRREQLQSVQAALETLRRRAR